MGKRLGYTGTTIAAYALGISAAAMSITGAWLSFECRSLQNDIAKLEVRYAQAKKENAAKLSELAALKKKQAKGPSKGNASLAIQNNNPLNVKARANDPWLGQIGKDKHGHAIFKSPVHGIRAGSLVLRTYAKEHKIATIPELVERFAEGNRAEYTVYLCRKLKVKDTDNVDIIKRMPELLKAMASFETGKSWPDELFLPYHVMAKL